MMKIAGGATFIAAAAAAAATQLLFFDTTVKPTDAFGFTCTNRSTRHHHQQRQQQRQRISAFDDNNNDQHRFFNPNLYNHNINHHHRISSINHKQLFASSSSSSTTQQHDEFRDDDDDDDTQGQQNRRWFMETYNLTEKQLNSKLEKCRYNAMPTSTLISRANCLQEKLVLTDEEMTKLVRRWPKVFNVKFDTCLEPAVNFLKISLKFDEKSLKKLLYEKPSVMGLKTEVIESKVELLKRRLKPDETKLRKIIMGGALSLSIETINAKIDWLQHRLNLDDNQVSRIVQKLNFFHYSISDKMEPNLQWLQKRLSLADNKQLSSIITRQPQLLYLNTDSNLGPTLEFYADAFGSEDVAIAFVCKNPISLARSLEKCLHRRLAEAGEAGLDIDPACIRRIALSSNKSWDKYLEKRRHK